MVGEKEAEPGGSRFRCQVFSLYYRLSSSHGIKALVSCLDSSVGSFGLFRTIFHSYYTQFVLASCLLELSPLPGGTGTFCPSLSIRHRSRHAASVLWPSGEYSASPTAFCGRGDLNLWPRHPGDDGGYGSRGPLLLESINAVHKAKTRRSRD